jgi:hypothetical protein
MSVQKPLKLGSNAGGKEHPDPTSVKRMNPNILLGTLKDIELTIIQIWLISQKI